MTTDKDELEIRNAVRSAYRARAAETTALPAANSCCASSCCGPQEVSATLGYSDEEMAAVPEGANLGLGCGNPLGIASLRPGETVLDLGSGGGFDCFLAAQAVGPEGCVIGVDMTPEMIELARKNVAKTEFQNVSFRLGEIEHLPVENESVDVILSNCVINLAPDKKQVYSDAHRVLKSGGRLAISDVVALKPLTDAMRNNMEMWCSCASGAMLVGELSTMLSDIGFDQVLVDVVDESRDFIKNWLPDSGLENFAAAARITAVKP